MKRIVNHMEEIDKLKIYHQRSMLNNSQNQTNNKLKKKILMKKKQKNKN